ncbi:MAG: HAD family phosphatase [Rubrivivax sp.]|nr:HAD family phosphatase [Rubrivivax sp.]
MRAPSAAVPGPGTVVFDFGAVLFRWKPYELLQQVAPEYARDEASARELAAQVFQSFTPDSDWARFDLGLLDEPELAQRIARRTQLTVEAMGRVIQAVPGHLSALPASVALFRALRAAGHRMVFLSNMPRPYALLLEQENPFIAEFDDGIFSGRVGLIKPWPAIYQLAQHRFGLQPGARTVFLDDHAGNVNAGRAFGWQGVVFQDAAQAEAELRLGGWL